MTAGLTINSSPVGPPASDRQEPAHRPASAFAVEPSHAQPPAHQLDAADYGVTLRVDDRTHDVIAVVVDRDTQRVVREIPSEEMRVAGDVIRNLLQVHIDTRA